MLLISETRKTGMVSIPEMEPPIQHDELLLSLAIDYEP